MKATSDNWTTIDGVDIPRNVLAKTQEMADASGKVFYAGFSRMRDDWIITNDREQVKMECNDGGFVGVIPGAVDELWKEATSPLPEGGE